MDNQLLGGLIGLGIAIAGYLMIGQLIGRMERMSGNERNPEQQKIVSILKAVRNLDLVIFPAVMYFAFGFVEGQIIG
jgi:hypothetical protein